MRDHTHSPFSPRSLYRPFLSLLTTTKVLLLRHIRVAAKREIPISIGGAVQHASGEL